MSIRFIATNLLISASMLVVAFMASGSTTQAVHTCYGLPNDEYQTCINNPASAHNSGGGATGNQSVGAGGNQGGGNDAIYTLKNPLKATNFKDFLLEIIDILLVFALPIVIFFIVLAGFKFVTARGDSGEISEAKQALTWAVIGGVIIFGARTIIAVIQGTVKSLQ